MNLSFQSMTKLVERSLLLSFLSSLWYVFINSWSILSLLRTKRAVVINQAIKPVMRDHLQAMLMLLRRYSSILLFISYVLVSLFGKVVLLLLSLLFFMASVLLCCLLVWNKVRISLLLLVNLEQVSSTSASLSLALLPFE